MFGDVHLRQIAHQVEVGGGFARIVAAVGEFARNRRVAGRQQKAPK